MDDAIREAWRPYQLAHRGVWWECVPKPDDEELGEGEWRANLREMACDSLGLLRAAIPHADAKALFDERLWGSIIGMFELNNLAVTMQSPVESYFVAVDELEGAVRDAVMAVTQPLLDALDTDYDISFEGTGFYALQSCLNHAHRPNAGAMKGDADLDGSAVIVAKRAIAAGDEVCISYVDEDAASEVRMAILRDYGIHK